MAGKNEGLFRQSHRVVANLRDSFTFKESRKRCREAVGGFLANLWDRNNGVRGVRWNNEATDEKLLEWIVNVGYVVAKARSTVSVWREKYEKNEYAYNQPIIEEPDRISAILYNVARGHALVNGRTHLTTEDLAPIIEIGLSSMPDDRRQVVQMLLESPSKSVSSVDVERRLSISRDTARAVMKVLAVLGIGKLEEGTGQMPHTLTLAEEFEWATSEKFRSLRAPEVWEWMSF